MAKGELPNKANADPTAPKQEGLAFSFGGLAAVFRAKANLAENEIKTIEARQKLEADILDAQIESTKANQGLAAAAIALWEAFHPKP